MRSALVLGVGLMVASAVHVWAAAGSFDPSFGTGGHVITELGPNAVAGAVVRQPDGKLVVLGSAQITGGSSNRHIVLVRYTADGGVDPSFGTDGIANVDIGVYALDRALLRLPDEKLLVVAFSVSAPSKFTLIRLTPDGVLDPTFGGDGVIEPVLGQGIDAVAAALQP